MATIKLPEALHMWSGAVNNYIDGIDTTKLEPSLTIEQIVHDRNRASLNAFAEREGTIIGLDDSIGKICNSPGKIWSAVSADSTSSAVDWSNDHLIYCNYDCDYPPSSVSLYKSYCSNSAYSQYTSSVASDFFLTSYSQYQSRGVYYSPSNSNNHFAIHFLLTKKKTYCVLGKYETQYNYILKIHFDGSADYKETDCFIGFRIIL